MVRVLVVLSLLGVCGAGIPAPQVTVSAAHGGESEDRLESDALDVLDGVGRLVLRFGSRTESQVVWSPERW